MKGKIYVLDTGEFRKIGKTTNFEQRKTSLMSEYGVNGFKSEWISQEVESFNEAECIAHSIVNKFSIGNEKFHCTFEDSVKACMSAIVRSSQLISAGDVDGIEVLVDPATGYINATKFIKTAESQISLSQFLKNDSVSYLNEEIIKRTGSPTYFSTRGRDSATFIHPYIFIEINRSLGARRKVKVYKWMLDVMPTIPEIRACIESTMFNS